METSKFPKSAIFFWLCPYPILLYLELSNMGLLLQIFIYEAIETVSNMCLLLQIFIYEAIETVSNMGLLL